MEFRTMRRKGQLLPAGESREILLRGRTGVLALFGDGDYPYALPINYVYCPPAETIYFHCAKAGHKIDAVRRHPKASLCVVAEDTVLPAEYATAYRSVIVFGGIRVVEDPTEIRRAITAFTEKYCPDRPEPERRQEIAKDWNALGILALSVAHLTGKESKGLAKARAAQEKN